MRRFSLVLAALLSFSPVARAETDFSGAIDVLQADDRQQSLEEMRESTVELLPLNDSSSSSSSSASPFVLALVGHEDVTFRDVPRTAWFAPFVRDVLEQGWMSGYRSENGALLGFFGPDDAVTIEQLAKVAVGVSGSAARCEPTAPLLNAAAKGRWSEDAIRCAEYLHWSVFSEGAEDPARPALRSEVVVTMLQAFAVVPTAAVGGVFTDVARNIPFAAFIERAARDGVVGGYTDASGRPTGLFGPDDRVNRAALAKILLTASTTYGPSAQ